MTGTQRCVAVRSGPTCANRTSSRRTPHRHVPAGVKGSDLRELDDLVVLCLATDEEDPLHRFQVVRESLARPRGTCSNATRAPCRPAGAQRSLRDDLVVPGPGREAEGASDDERDRLQCPRPGAIGLAGPPGHRSEIDRAAHGSDRAQPHGVELRRRLHHRVARRSPDQLPDLSRLADLLADELDWRSSMSRTIDQDRGSAARSSSSEACIPSTSSQGSSIFSRSQMKPTSIES